MNVRIASLALVGALCASAAAQYYAQRTVDIKAAVAVIESDQVGGFPANRAPHVWYNLNQNRRVKPAAFSFVNNAHETQISAATNTRWTAISGSSPNVDTQVQKQHAPYWELRLSTATDAQLADLDILLLAAHGTMILNPTERDKLRRFVEKGGVLWVDFNQTSVVDPINNLPLPVYLSSAVAGTTPGVDYTQPIVSYPANVTEQDLFLMQSDGLNAFRYADLNSVGLLAFEPIFMNLMPDSLRLAPAVYDNKGAILLSGRLGDGFVVVTTRGVATTLNRIPVTGGWNANLGPVALAASFDRASDAAAKIAINAISLVSGHAQPRAGSRRTSSTAIELGAPQLARFKDTSVNLTPTSINGYRPPSVFKGALVVTTDSQVLVYDANPKQDLDGDGDPDDGVPDYGTGGSQDLIWAGAALSGPISAPTCFEEPNAVTPALRNQVAVTTLNGEVVSYNLFPYDVNGKLVGNLSTAPQYALLPTSGGADTNLSLPDAGPYPPVYHEGFLYVGDCQDVGLSKSGRIWMVDAAKGAIVVSGPNQWSMGGTAATALPDPSGPLTIGYVPILDNSGGLDKVIYVPGRPNLSIPGANGAASIYSLWAGVKGEKPSSWTTFPAYLEVSTRAASQGLDVHLPSAANDSKSLGVRLSIVKPNGDPYTPAEMTTVFSGAVSQTNGIVRFVYNAGQAIGANDQVRMDYTIDYGTGFPSTVQQVIRGFVNLPDDGDRERRILHGLSLSPQGTLHLAMSSQDPANKPGGAYYAIKEEGRGNFKVINRFDLYQPHILTLNQANDINYPETLKNSDPLVTTMIPFLAGTMNRLTFMGGPVIRNGVAYVTAKATRFFIPYTIVLAFRAEPEAKEIRVGEVQAGFSILQPDLSRSNYASGGRPDTYSALQPSQYVYEREGRDSTGTVRIDNLASTTRGPILNCLNTSQPVIIRQNNRQDVLVEPSQTGSRWSQLLWYTVFSGVDTVGPAFASGETLFLAGSSSWPTILAGGPGFTPAGQVFAMDTKISPSDKFLGSADPSRPWFKQLYFLLGSGFANIEPNPAMLWPSLTGITTWGDYQIRLQQTVLQMSGGTYASMAHGIAGGDSGLFSWANEGIWGFGKADFWVADEGRIIRTDASGQPKWSMTQTFKTGPEGDTGAAAETRQLVRPTRAYPVGDREVIIVDSGANRVVKTDASGRELRSLTGYHFDATFRPTGVSGNAPYTFNVPRDVLTFNTIVAAANNPMSNAQPYEYWIHWLVADSGNGRLLEIVDRYGYDINTRQVQGVVVDTAGVRGAGVLYWHSPPSVSGAKFQYTSLARARVGGNWVYAAGIGNKLPTKTDLGLDTPATATIRTSDEGNGGIVLFNGANSVVINEVTVPAIGPNVYRDDAAGTFTLGGYAQRTKRLGGLSSISMRFVDQGGGPQLTVMFTDSEGVFEVYESAPGVWTVDWMLDRAAYRAIRRDNANNLTFSDNPDGFLPTYARRLESNEVLICNGYSGYYRRALVTDPRVPCTGEVLLMDGDWDTTGTNPFGFNVNKTNLGFRTLSIRALLNNKPGANTEMRGIILPFFADKQ